VRLTCVDRNAIHSSVGTSFLLVGLSFLGTSVFLAHTTVMTYLGSFFALCGALDLVLAWLTRRSAGDGAQSVA
jgi:hypothetical protein